MISLGNIALVLKGPSNCFKVRLQYSYFFPLSLLPSSFSFGSKSLLHLILVLTRLCSSSSDVGVKNSLTQEGPMHLQGGSSGMSYNLSPVSELLLFLWRALAFSACTWFLDPMSYGHLRGYGRSGIVAAGGAEMGLSWFCGCMATASRW